MRDDAILLALGCWVFLGLSAALSLTPLPVCAQDTEPVQATGTLIGEGDGQVLSGAMVALLHQGTVIARTATGADGRFSVELPGPGVYVIQVDLLGYADWLSQPVRISASEDFTLFVPLSPIELEAVVAEGMSECRAPMDDLRAGFELLEELVPVLRDIERNSSLKNYRYAIELIRPKMGWEHRSWTFVGRDTVRFLTDVVLAVEPPEALARSGYAVAVDDTLNLYLAPGPGTVASEVFRQSHCISLVRDDNKGLVGLAWEPKQLGEIVDVEGTLWVEIREGRPIPQRLEFTYVNVLPHMKERQLPWLRAKIEARYYPGPIPRIHISPIDASRKQRGYLVFREVSEGLVLITEWEVRQLLLGWRGSFDNSGASALPHVAGRLWCMAPLVTSKWSITLAPGAATDEVSEEKPVQVYEVPLSDALVHGSGIQGFSSP